MERELEFLGKEGKLRLLHIGGCWYSNIVKRE